MHKFTFSTKGKNLLQETVVYLTVLMLIFVIGFSYSLTQFRILVFFAAFLTLLGGLWFFAKQKAATPLKPFIFLWIAAYSISVILSMDPRRSLNQMFLMLVGVFLFLLTYDLVSRGWEIGIFMKSFVLVGSILTVISLYEAGSWYFRWISTNPNQLFPDISYRLGTTNLMPPFMFLTFNLSLPFLIKSKSKIIKLALAVIMFLSMVVLYLTSSRAGWLGMFFGLVVWALYFLFTARTTILAAFRKLFANKILFVASLIFVLTVAVLGGILLYKQAVHPTHGNIFTSRKGLWGPAISAFKENPLFGQGPFTYPSVFLKENSVPPDSIYAHGHSIYLNLLAEMGIAGFLAALFFFIAYFRKFKLRYSESKNKLAMIGIFAFIISSGAHNIFDSYHTKPAMLWPLAILAAAAIARPLKESKIRIPSQPWWVLGLIAFAWLGIWTITPYYQAVDLANQTQWQSAYEKFQQAVKRDPGNGLAHQQLALSAAVLAENGDSSKLEVAITALETAIQHEPSWALNYANLAALYLSNDKPDLAVQTAERAVELAPRAPLYALNLGVILEQNDDDQLAQAAYRQALKLNPQWATADFWDETDFRSKFINTWQQDHQLNQPLSVEQAKEIWENNQQYCWSYNQFASILLESGNLEQAKIILDNAGFAYATTPLDNIETNWLQAEYYAKLGSFQKAVSMGSSALVRYRNYGADGPGSFGILQYAPIVYRMPALALEIVPQMVTVPVPEIWVERKNQLNDWKAAQQ